MEKNKCMHFKPKHNGLFKDKNAPSLLLDLEHNIFEYTFVKKKAKTKDEMLLDLKLNRNPIAPNSTIVTVTMKLSDIVMVDYNPALDSIMIVGAFCVTYKNNELGQEIVRNYTESNNCFSIEDEFEHIKLFVDTIESFEKTERCDRPLVLVSL